MTKDEIIQHILASKGYKGIDQNLVEYYTEQALKRFDHDQTKKIIKYVKQELHKIYGAFNKNVNFEKIYNAIKDAHESGDKQRLHGEILFAMQAHASSGERIEILDTFYVKIFEITGIPKTILDLACGINPLSALVIDELEGIHWTGYDIGQKEIKFMQNVVTLLGKQSNFTFGTQNLQNNVPNEKTDITLLLKTLPIIESQQKGRGIEILEEIKSPYIVVSYPLVNLGIIKKKKGMPEFYRNSFYEMIKNKPWEISEIEFNSELVFVIKK